VCLLLSSGVAMLLPLASKNIVDKGLVCRNFLIVFKFVLISFLLILIDQGIGIFETKYYAYINSLFQFNLSKIAFKHILNLKLQYLNSVNFAEIMSTTSMDIGNISRISDKSMFILISQIFRFFGGLIGLLLIDWRMTLLVLLMASTRYFIVKYMAKKRKQMVEEFIEYNREFAAWYGDTISGIKEIKLMGTHKIKIGQFIKKQRKIIKLNLRMAYLDKFNEFSESIIMHIIINSLYLIGAYLVSNSALTIGGLFTFITYSSYVTGPVSSVINIGYSFSNLIPSAKRFFEFLEMDTESRPYEKLIRLQDCQTCKNIKFEDISFLYRDGETVLNKLNFEIKSGEKVAIIGHNGSGKSTLINLILNFYTPQSGRILLGDTDIKHLNLRDYRKQFSVVSQDFYIFNTTIEENISGETMFDESKIQQAAIMSSSQEFIDSMPLNYKSVVGRNGSKLSGGQRQKIAVARSFMRDSNIIILDEATSNFDLTSETYVTNLITKGFKNKTVILISHKTNILKQVDKILLLQNGEIKDIGNHEDLWKRNAFYREMLQKSSSNAI
jgi:ATP-binding cassette subfamily B protein